MWQAAAEMVFQEYPVFVYTEAEHCDSCGRVADSSAAHMPDDADAPVFDVSESLDGAIIASTAFRGACSDIDGIHFQPLFGAEGWWLVTFDSMVEIDPFDSEVRTGTACATCDRPRYVIRDGAIRLGFGVDLPVGFSATTHEFGDSGDFGAQPIRMRPHVLVDTATRTELKAAGLLGIHFVIQP